MTIYRFLWIPLWLAGLCGAALAQSTQVAFGAIKQDTTLPVEVTAEALTVDQASGMATFKGNVSVSQGDMQLRAGAVLVVYRKDADGIARLEASEGVTLSSGPDEASAEQAEYDIDTGVVDLTGGVVFMQGPARLTAQTMVIRLNDGTAELSGGVRTTLTSGQN